MHWFLPTAINAIISQLPPRPGRFLYICPISRDFRAINVPVGTTYHLCRSRPLNRKNGKNNEESEKIKKKVLEIKKK